MKTSLRFILITLGLVMPCLAQDSLRDHFYAGLPESDVRQRATASPLPSYPNEAVQHGISGVVRLKIEIDVEGNVLRVKVKPGTQSLLKKAAAEAAKKWHFEPVPDPTGLKRSSLGRLTFHFVINGGVGAVSLFDPGRDAPDPERLGYYNSPKEFKEWEFWEEITDK